MSEAEILRAALEDIRAWLVGSQMRKKQKIDVALLIGIADMALKRTVVTGCGEPNTVNTKRTKQG